MALGLEIEQAAKLYNHILVAANFFLTVARRRFSVISEMKKENNPSLKEVAELAGELAELVTTLVSDIDAQMTAQANDYVYLVKSIVEAIEADDQTELDRLIEELGSKPFAAAEENQNDDGN